MLGKTFTVTEQEEAESSTTTVKLFDTIKLSRNSIPVSKHFWLRQQKKKKQQKTIKLIKDEKK